jgi:hypothetical protein
MKTVFLRALEASDKAEALRAAIRAPAVARGRQHFEVDPAGFAIAYGQSSHYSRRLSEATARPAPEGRPVTMCDTSEAIGNSARIGHAIGTPI